LFDKKKVFEFAKGETGFSSKLARDIQKGKVENYLVVFSVTDRISIFKSNVFHHN